MNHAIIGCGYIGKMAGLALKKQGGKVFVTTTSKEKIADLESFFDKVFILRGEESEKLEQVLCEMDTLLVTVAPNSKENYASTYLKTAYAIKNIVPHCRRLKHLIYTSSTSVYGDCRGETVDESWTVKGNSIHSKLLIETEQIFLSLHSTIPFITILRLGEIYGPGRDFLDKIRPYEGATYPFSGKSFTNIIHAEDVVKAITFTFSNVLQGIYNLVNDFHVPRKNFYQILIEKHGLKKIHFDQKSQSIHSGNKIVSNQKIKQKGFTFIHPNIEL